jgi:eukaryotic-like serine/threonine-protein kinase
VRALVLYYTKHPADAETLLREVVTDHPNLNGVRPFLAMSLSRQGKREQALAEITESVKRNATVDPDIAYAVASVYALEGDSATAFEWLERSVALGNANKPCFAGDPNLKSLRDDTRFVQLMQKIA